MADKFIWYELMTANQDSAEACYRRGVLERPISAIRHALHRASAATAGWAA